MTNRTDYTKRSAEEARTHELMDTYRDAAWTSTRAVMAMVWKARYHAALTVKDINETAKVLANLAEVPDLQAELTAMTRAKVLRSYTKQGRKLYEVNY